MGGKLISRIGLLVFLGGLLLGCADNPEERATKRGEEILFEENQHDYGEIAKNSDGTWSFIFKNVGKKAIVVNRVRSSCGCTVPTWPREPIKPNGSGEIIVEYNTAQTGTFMKSVFVFSTAANSPVKLQIQGKVIHPEK